ncbi:Eco57I restriction-modification methylase domain-containing protein [Cyanobium gracile UHCC 0139]|uniref:site-specific DNA-methyltransferase (adenine-specific) n=1 Tax=Cyanobium gracile UHCC 0139 TaxID=3110308 RepID=A0ABU5RU28_9CYAN|nr:Eco57I restriction-modification methylase domain-containing protein [Cyanobium gracile]MEA5391297.1 Eco57I restriction-modification methylase domain-containing protein [Cyanobium gracile UHCC 0139]
MDKNQAHKLIQRLFSQSFDLESYRHFVRNLLNHYEDRSGHYTGNYIPDAFKQHVNQYWRIGKYVDPDGNQLDLLVVEVKSLAKLERARSSLRNFAVNRLKQFEKEASLIAFYAQDDHGADWRFSFVKIEHEAYQDDKGKVKLKQELTPARRYSYLVGQHENSHTACRQLLPVLEMDYADPKVEEIEAAFSIEKITDEFFDQYKALFQKLAEQLKKQTWFRQASNEETDQAVSRFAKKLLGQIVFLYFLQKKGWLGAAKGKAWGEGSRRFLRERYQQSEQVGGNYFRDFLQYLFYEALACKRDKQDDPGYYDRFQCRVPFLNGGLFESDYDWRQVNIEIPNSLFHNDEKTRAGDVGTGILDVFDRYNFTIKEDEPLDKEVAVDPEMLGKVFENMLEITERKSKGAFYTPREIVHYMCQESLIHYLDNRLNTYPTSYEELDSPQTSLLANTTSKGQLKLSSEHQDIKVPKADIETLIRKGHLALENDTRVLSKGKETKDYKFQLPESVREHANAIDDSLADIKVCDPAIGSGAFPVGLLHEIVGARQALAPHTGNNRSAYDLKRHAIAESIYGVDIDASAIDIARLRLWLSLIVDEEDYGTIAALPNLDYKIVRGDSLVGFPENWTSPAFAQLEALKKQFFAETDNDKKAALKTQIDIQIQERLANSKQVFGHQVDFDFRLMFSEIWHKKGGFDVVIGNPPYFNIDTFGAKSPIQEFLKKNYKVYMDKSDILFYFFERGCRISSGLVVLITSNAFLNAEKAKKLRTFLLEGDWIRRIINFENYMAFKEASITTAISLLRRRGAQPSYLNLQKETYKDDELLTLMAQESNYVVANDWNADGFTLADAKLWPIIKSIDGNNPRLFEKYKIGSGMQTGYNNAFVFKEYPKEFPSECIKKRITGGIIEKYTSKPPKEWILYIEDIDHFEDIPKPVKDHLTYYKNELSGRADKRRRKTAKWWNFTFPMHKDLYANEKIWCSYRAPENRFCLDDTNDFIGLTNTTVIFNTSKTVNFKYTLALLNSEVATFRYRFIGKKTGNNLLEYFENGVGKIPLVIADTSVQEVISMLVEFILSLNRTNHKLVAQFFEQLVHGLVYELYFPAELIAAGKDILRHLGKLAPITDAQSSEEKLAIIQREFDRLYDPRHPVRNIIETLDSVEVVHTIREALKR